MGRPPGSKNSAGAKKGKAAANGTSAPKSAAPKMAAAQPDEAKRNKPSAEDTAEFLAQLTTLKTAARSIAGDIAALGARAKSWGGPAYWKSIKRVHDLLKLDAREAVAELEALVEVAAQQDIRIAWMGDQATFADIMEQAKPAAPTSLGAQGLKAARAHSDGFNSGKNGAVPADNPFSHAPGSEEYVAWHDGRDEGQQAKEGKNPEAARRVKAAQTADASLPDDGKSQTTADSVF